MKNKVVIIIPIYKNKLEENEKISLEQVFRVLGGYDICLIGPEKMEFSFLQGITGTFYREEFFPSYFDSISSYNGLMLEEEFYDRFLKYEYMLIYQLDAFVFEDKLEYFCSLGYDYIGAPWLCGEVATLQGRKVCCYVGNGGLSLRRIAGVRTLLKKEKISNEQNEDLFFAASASGEFCVAPIDIALKFSFERQVRKCYEKNQYELPFGCHAWEKYDLEFWKPLIEQYGYKIKEITLKNQNDRLLEQLYKLKERESYICKYGWSEYLQIQFGNCNGELAIWGAGFLGSRLCKFLLYHGVEVKYVIDNNPLLQCEHLEGIKIISWKEALINEKLNVIVAVEKYKKEISLQMETHGFQYKEKYVFWEDIIDKDYLLAFIYV